MIRIRQDNRGGRGNCMAACWASILEVPLDDVPDYRRLEAAGDPWLNAVNTWLSKHHGRIYYELDWFLTRQLVPLGYHLINGDSYEDAGGHSCVGYAGRVVWDPMGRAGRGLRRVDNFGLLVPVDARLRDTWERTWADCGCRWCGGEWRSVEE